MDTMGPIMQLLPNFTEPFKDFQQKMSENLIWLSEVYGQALEALNRPGIELLPKTPSQKVKRKGRKQARKSSIRLKEAFPIFDASLVHATVRLSTASVKIVTKKVSEEEKKIEEIPVAPASVEILADENSPKKQEKSEKKSLEFEKVEEKQKISTPEFVNDEKTTKTRKSSKSKSSTNDAVIAAVSVEKSPEKRPNSRNEEKKSKEKFPNVEILPNDQPQATTPHQHATRSKFRKIQEKSPPKQAKIEVELGKTVTRSKTRKLLDAEAILQVQSNQNADEPKKSLLPVPTTTGSAVKKFFNGGSAIKNCPATITRPPSTMSCSFLRASSSATPLSNLPPNISSFIKRNTPLKVSKQEQEANLQERLRQQELKQQQASVNKEEILRRKMEEQRQKRLDRDQKIAAWKEQKKKQEEERMKRKLEPKQQPSTASQSKEIDEHSQVKKKQKMMTVIDSETKHRQQQQEDEQRRLLEQEAQLRAKEHAAALLAKQREEEARAVAKAKRDAELLSAAAKSTLQQTTKEKTSPTKKQPVCVATDSSGSSTVSRQTFNVSATGAATKLNPSASVSNTTKDGPETYAMTPVRQYKPSSDTNYDITDLNSEDETDDEEAPRKKIPFWAQGAALKAALVQQYYNTDFDAEGFFGAMFAPDLTKMFKIQRRKFKQRTSSAIWESSFQAFRDI